MTSSHLNLPQPQLIPFKKIYPSPIRSGTMDVAPFCFDRLYHLYYSSMNFSHPKEAVMGKLITLVILLGASFGIYRGCFYQSPAYKTYLQWTKATNEGDCKTLNAIADGEAKKWVDSFCN